MLTCKYYSIVDYMRQQIISLKSPGRNDDSKGDGGRLSYAVCDLQGLLFRGTAPAMRVKAPFSKPELPSPATVRPKMKNNEEVETAQSREPISKIMEKNKNVFFALR